jgi:hypothetical protein
VDAVAWSGISSVPSTWTTSQIPDLATTKITSGTFSVDPYLLHELYKISKLCWSVSIYTR